MRTVGLDVGTGRGGITRVGAGVELGAGEGAEASEGAVACGQGEDASRSPSGPERSQAMPTARHARARHGSGRMTAKLTPEGPGLSSKCAEPMGASAVPYSPLGVCA